MALPNSTPSGIDPLTSPHSEWPHLLKPLCLPATHQQYLCVVLGPNPGPNRIRENSIGLFVFLDKTFPFFFFLVLARVGSESWECWDSQMQP